MKDNSSSKDKIILGEYEVISTVREDSVFRWEKATEIKSGNSAIIQTLRLQCSHEEISCITNFFESLLCLKKKSLWLPTHLLADVDYPMVLVYADAVLKSLEQVMKEDSNTAIELWSDASESLHFLHNRDITHGFVSPESFIVFNDQLYLTGFGYSPLLESRNRVAIERCTDFCAPELIENGFVTKESDTYAFAKTVAHYHPDIKQTDWYEKGTHKDPSNRFSRMREMFQSLMEAFKSLTAKKAGEETTEKKPENPKTEKITKDSKSGIVRKYNLEVCTSPEEGGTVQGTGSYAKGKAVNLLAESSVGYVFDRWEGDICCDKNPISVIIESDKKVIAVFVKAPEKRQYTLLTKAQPAKGGSVEGGGTQVENTKITIKAVPEQGWGFNHWSGSLTGSRNPADILIDTDKYVVAHFSSGLQVKLTVIINPPEAVKAVRVRASDKYIKGTKVKVQADVLSTDWKFVRWEEDLSSTSNPCTLIMDRDKSIIAHFEHSIFFGFPLNVRVEPKGAGRVEGDGTRHEKGKNINVMAEAKEGWVFSKWSGDIEGIKNPIRIKMSSEKTVVAHFIKEEGSKESESQSSREKKIPTRESGSKEKEKKNDTANIGKGRKIKVSWINDEPTMESSSGRKRKKPKDTVKKNTQENIIPWATGKSKKD